MSEGSHTSVETRQNLSRVIPPEIADILGHPPVLSTENRQAYDELMTQLALEWKPRRKITDWMYVRDIADPTPAGDPECVRDLIQNGAQSVTYQRASGGGMQTLV
jgi:hypothetical protein